jgi:glycosyltransferase involved in cell wall biosynthesis
MGVSRVAFLSSEYPPHVYGGLGITVEALSRYLGASGIDVVVLVPDSGGYAAAPAGVQLVQVGVENATSDGGYWLDYCRSAVKIAADTNLRADVIHCHDWMTALAGVAIGRLIEAPVVMSVHLPQAMQPNLTLEDIGIAGSDAVIVNSLAVAQELTERNDRQTDGPQIVTIPNGVDLKRFRPDEQARDPCTILYVGRLVPQKGVDVLLRAFGAVVRRHRACQLIIAGDGQQRLYLQRLARFLGVSQRVEFLTWQTPEQLARLYRTATVTAVPSLYEPFGLVALEAMASGCPVVVSRVGGLGEIVEDGVSGLAVEPADHLDLASALAAVLSQARLSDTIGRGARRRAERFDWAAIAEATAGLYGRLQMRSDPRAAAALAQVLERGDESVRNVATRLLTPRPDCHHVSDPFPRSVHSEGLDHGC